ncbi:hypothetical protein O3P69_001482 [Scylla paramamosain]|uniref:Glucosylceramidase n=1 Tax=Scylla paramamosain TaxID=85552 RepID=A0AAW0UXQ6_SCYPA
MYMVRYLSKGFYSGSQKQVILTAYYSPEGLEYTMGRVPVGGTDFSTHPYTYDDLPLARLTLFDKVCIG